jgi:hypothetical protein
MTGFFKEFKSDFPASIVVLEERLICRENVWL